MKFENVSLLIESIKEVIKEMRFCWVDTQGIICEQVSTFRVNCIDCLDRTNVVQTAIARTVMDFQFTRLGLLPPEGQLPHNCRRIFQTMWANNGDIISRQYAGTAALKGDFTRTGERKLAGAIKDSYNSASRYYLNRFKDAYRQAAIDVMLGNPVADSDLNSPDAEEADEALADDDSERHERIKQVIEDCKKILITEAEVILGGWPLIDGDPVTGSSPNSQEMDTVLILTKDCYYVAEYDDQTDRITRYQRVLLEDLEKIEFGHEPGTQLMNRVRNRGRYHMNYCIRFHYVASGQTGYFHMFRPTDTRFFNNMAIPIRTAEEEIESLKAICESFKVALSVRSLNVPFFEGKLEKRKSKTVTFGGHTTSGHRIRQKQHLSESRLPRNISDGNLLNLKSVGSKALTGVSSQFAKFKGRLTGSGNKSSSSSLAVLNEPKDSPSDSLTTISSNVTFDVDTEDEDVTEAEEESTRGRRRPLKDQSSTASVNSVFMTERSGSDYSECSDFEADHDLEQNDAPAHRGPGSTGGKSNSTIVLKNPTSDAILTSCGILTTSPPLKVDGSVPVDLDELRGASKRSVLEDVDDFVLDAMKKASLKHLRRKASEQTMPVIHVHDPLCSTSSAGEDSFSGNERNSTMTAKSILMSKSTEDIDLVRQNTLANSRPSATSCAALAPLGPGSSADVDMDQLAYRASVGHLSLSPNILGSSTMKGSHSDQAIFGESVSSLSLNLSHLTGPSSPMTIRKDLVLSPLSRIAKGVQSLGANLRSAGNYIPSHRKSNPNLMDPEEYEKLKQRKRSCKSRIIEL